MPPVLTYQVTKQMVEARSVAVPFGETDGLGEAHRGRDGRYYAPFGLGQSIYNIPFYLAGASPVRDRNDKVSSCARSPRPHSCVSGSREHTRGTAEHDASVTPL